MNHILIYFYNTPLAVMAYSRDLESNDFCERMLEWYADRMDYDILNLAYKHIDLFDWETCT